MEPKEQQSCKKNNPCYVPDRPLKQSENKIVCLLKDNKGNKLYLNYSSCSNAIDKLNCPCENTLQSK